MKTSKLFLFLEVAKQEKKAEQILNLIIHLKDYKFHSIKELSNNLNINYKAVFKYLKELEKLEIVEKNQFVDGIKFKLKKDFKQIIKRKLKDKFKSLIKILEQL